MEVSPHEFRGPHQPRQILGGIGVILRRVAIVATIIDNVLGTTFADGALWVRLPDHAIAAIYPMLAVYAKRWHDRDKSGWWTLIGLVPFIGAIWLLVECGILEGTRGPNSYGPDPLA